VSRIRHDQALVIEGYIEVSGLSKLTNIRYESRGGGREWFPYRGQTSKFQEQYRLLQGHRGVPKWLQFRHSLSNGLGIGVSFGRFDL